MAEATPNANIQTKKVKDDLECAVCLQTCIHPAQLPCGHIFCFLCVKGIANQSKKCAMCRQEIPRDFIEQPTLLPNSASAEQKSFDEGYQWFYEGRNGWWQYDERANEELESAYKLNQNFYEILICGQLYIIDFDNKFQYPKKHPQRKRFIKREKLENLQVKGVAGWWQYDERTSKELETAYKSGDKTCELLIAGFLYIVDLENMLQLRRNDPSRRRNIKRDLASIPKKGIAGLRTDVGIQDTQSGHITPIYETRTDLPIPVTPSNTPQSPTSGRESPEIDILERIQALRLDTNLLRSRRHSGHNDQDCTTHRRSE